MDITADNPDLVDAVLKAAVGDDRVWYVIHKGKIISRTYGWANNDYKGSNPHDSHIHISLRSDSKDSALFAENNTTSWLDPVMKVADPAPQEPQAPEPVDEAADKLQRVKRALEQIIRELEG